MGERLVCNQEVAGSIPVVSTRKSFIHNDLGRQNSPKELKVFWLPVTKTPSRIDAKPYCVCLTAGTKTLPPSKQSYAGGETQGLEGSGLAKHRAIVARLSVSESAWLR